ncbi:hypothetical protein VTJ83DRAFT_543 [Remersonia thermophila]|uniref:EKC/KEOPS complex subunit GON7 n=1 Tax=Remersonia thermophila TaxID=72144 RepID=A0ABR4DN09_9PEZI
MASNQQPDNASSNHASSPDATTSTRVSVNDHLAQALRELARGEQTASTLEANLTNLESKLDAILASLLGDGVDEGESEDEGEDKDQDRDKGEHQPQGKQQQEETGGNAPRKQQE